MRNWRAVNALFLVSTILESLAMGHLNAYTPLFLQGLGLTPAEVGSWTGIMYAAMMAIAFPLAPFWGPLAERYSRRLIIVRSQYFEALAYAIVAFAPNVWWILGSRLLLGLTFGNIAVVVATQALLTPSRHVGTAIAMIQIAGPIAASFGPPLGAGLIDSIGLRGLFLLDAGICLTAALLVTFLMPEPQTKRRAGSVLANTRETAVLVARRPATRWNFVSWFLSTGARAVVDVYLPVRITALAPDPAPVIGTILGVYGVLTAISTWIAARLVDEHGGIRWFGPAMAVAAIATIGMVVVPDVWVIGVLCWMRALPFAIANTILYAHLARILTRDEQTPVLALTTTPRNLSMFVMPSLAAAAAVMGAGAALMVGAACYGGASISGWLATRATRPRPQESGVSRQA
ncbi:MAG: MFS transporter [Chloroflexi bacterium]|nr:MFS transporter [Chloroflexota bacterium]